MPAEIVLSYALRPYMGRGRVLLLCDRLDRPGRLAIEIDPHSAPGRRSLRTLCDARDLPGIRDTSELHGPVGVVGGRRLNPKFVEWR